MASPLLAAAALAASSDLSRSHVFWASATPGITHTFSWPGCPAGCDWVAADEKGGHVGDGVVTAHQEVVLPAAIFGVLPHRL